MIWSKHISHWKSPPKCCSWTVVPGRQIRTWSQVSICLLQLPCTTLPGANFGDQRHISFGVNLERFVAMFFFRFPLGCLLKRRPTLHNRNWVVTVSWHIGKFEMRDAPSLVFFSNWHCALRMRQKPKRCWRLNRRCADHVDRTFVASLWCWSRLTLPLVEAAMQTISREDLTGPRVWTWTSSHSQRNVKQVLVWHYAKGNTAVNTAVSGIHTTLVTLTPSPVRCL